MVNPVLSDLRVRKAYQDQPGCKAIQDLLVRSD
jgi:hypothetical protein